MEEVIGSIPIIAMQIFIYINKSLPATGYTGCIARLTGSGGARKNGFDAKQNCPATIQPRYCFKMRLSRGLAFSAFIGEARSILRDAVEYVAHAHHMLRDPGNVAICVAKDNGEQEKKKFKEVPATCWQLDLSKPFPA
jgi:hypothetical protein